MPVLSPRRQTAVFALIVFFILGTLAIHASPLSAGSLEARLQTAAEAALYRVQADRWARVELNGQVATLTGRAPSRAARREALSALERASWAGGVVAGGITKVIDETRVSNEGEQVRLEANLNAGRLQLSGFAPNADAIVSLTQRAERIFPGRATVSLRIAPGASAEGWEVATRLMLTELARLDAGAARMAEGRLALVGLAGSSETVQSVRRTFEVGVPDFQVGALVRTDGGAYDATYGDAALCELLMDAAIGSGRVTFAPGSAVLSETSVAVLRRAGRAYSACEVGPLTVAVRAESNDETGELLALDRAESISLALSSGWEGEREMLAESAPLDAETAFKLSLPRGVAPQDDSAEDEAVSAPETEADVQPDTTTDQAPSEG